ncbi:putative stress-induced protein STI1 [Mycena belliarum]|uniref:Stress-induced protein STI1 n=1 Tax=Mycena belliarum TaxID=1033014 RepID=A0AAD6UJC9_9AGAR|nr:putative stress-induced protein STI1 [Mycena belliae]
MAEKQQRLVLSIIDFLKDSLDDIKADDKEGIEVAIQCIGEAFGVDPADEQQVARLSVKPATLPTIFDVFLKTREKVANNNTAQASSSASTSSQPKTTSAEDKAQAEKFKQTGNTQMSSKQYDQAIESYTQAIALDPTSAIYYSNRAAAYSSKGDHLSAVGDAEQAIAVDPKFVKAYHRLGHAQYSLTDFRAAADAFERGLKLDPTNAGLKSGLENANARIVPDDDDDDGPPPLTSDNGLSSSSARGAGGGGVPSMADMLAGLGGMGRGGGGGPDLASLMNNPQMMAMAQQMMANGGLANLMQNPAVANMMGRVQSGDMPSVEELMGDPTLRDIAQQFGGGMGRGA